MVIKKQSRQKYRWAYLSAAILAGAATLSPPLTPASLAQVNAAVSGQAIQTLRVPKGQKLAIPLSNVTRVITDDEEVVRVSFENGQAFLEGVAPGITTVRAQQGSSSDSTSQQYDVEVLGAGAASPVTEVPLAKPKTPANVPAAVATVKTTDEVPVEVLPAITPAVKQVKLNVSLSVDPAEDNPSQALFTIAYSNSGGRAAKSVTLRFALDDLVSYVSNSATGGGHYNAAKRELSWNIDSLPANTLGQTVSFRVAPLDATVEKFFSVATLEDADGAVASNTIEYSFRPTPLLTVFALPDRIIQGHTSPPLLDVKGVEYQAAIDRLQKLDVVRGTAPGIYEPAANTQRGEYTVMILRGLNLRDLRDLAAIKFVLSRRSVVKLEVRNSDGKVVAPLISNTSFEAGEHTVIWDGRTPTGYAAPGRYSYSCSARDASGMTTELKGYIHVIPQTPLQPSGLPSFKDVRPTAWYASYVALAEKQGLVQGYPNKEFRPLWPINKVEATAVAVRAMGLEDLSKRVGDKDAGFLDDNMIPPWAKGYVYVAASVAQTSSGKLIQGTPSNMFEPLHLLRRDTAALIVQRIVDKETNRRLYISGQMVPGATITINQKNVQARPDGTFNFTMEQSVSEPMTVAVIDRRH